VGLDARDGKVATDGWSKLTRHEVVDLARKFEDWGVESIIYTDIAATACSLASTSKPRCAWPRR
jgi:phosphoribosylformimino-5-aminoimidazole carboxamide ribonucleotide (ProFAR) isomerase